MNENILPYFLKYKKETVGQVSEHKRPFGFTFKHFDYGIDNRISQKVIEKEMKLEVLKMRINAQIQEILLQPFVEFVYVFFHF